MEQNLDVADSAVILLGLVLVLRGGMRQNIRNANAFAAAYSPWYLENV